MSSFKKDITQQTKLQSGSLGQPDATRLLDSSSQLPTSRLPTGRRDPFGEPESLGIYKVHRVLGQGGMGVVYYAMDEELQRPAAVKVITPSLADSDLAIERLRTEARAAARLSHPNIVSVYTFGEQDGLKFIAYEFVDGIDLSTVLRNEGALEPLRALRIIRQTAQALRFAWANHVVHRDIKPANLLILKDNTVKVADFGLAKCLDVDSGLTTSSTVVGSPAYMSPEQGMGSAVDFRSDIYSLGCTLYALLTATVPYSAETALGVMMKHANEPLPEPAAIKNLYAGNLIVLLRKMMAKKPDERHRSYDVLIDEIDALIRAVEGKNIRPAPVARKAGNFPVQRVLVGLGIAGVLLFGVFATIVLIDGRPTHAAPAVSLPHTTVSAPEPEANAISFMQPEIEPAGQPTASGINFLQNRAQIAAALSAGSWQEARHHLQVALQRPDMLPEARAAVSEIVQVVADLEEFEKNRYADFSDKVPFDVPIPRAEGLFRVEFASPDVVRGVSSNGVRGEYTSPGIPPTVKNSLMIGMSSLQPLQTEKEFFLELLYRQNFMDPRVDQLWPLFLERVQEPNARETYARIFQTFKGLQSFAGGQRPTPPRGTPLPRAGVPPVRRQ